METRKLELKDIAGYLPYELKMTKKLKGVDRGKLMIHLESGSTCYNHLDCSELKKFNVYPILRPLSDLYRTITHNGKEIVPIVELAKISKPFIDWKISSRNTFAVDLSDYLGKYFGYIKSEERFYLLEDYNDGYESKIELSVKNQYQLFDYLHELKIDYRGLIDAGLAIDVNTLENNPYK
jgi:hypothetical protein